MDDKRYAKMIAKRIINAHKYLNKMRKNKVHYQWDITGPMELYPRKGKTILVATMDNNNIFMKEGDL
jgi:hypothetical protein